MGQENLEEAFEEFQEDAEFQEEVKEEQEEADPEVERATSEGWKPEDEYEGDRPWVDHHVFNERGDRIKENKAATSKLEKMEKRVAKQDEKQARLSESIANTKRENIAALETEMQEAISDGDNDRVNLLRKKQSTLAGDIAKTPVSTEGPDTSAIATWREENAWISDTNNPLSHFASAKMQEYLDANTNSPSDVTTEILEQAVEYMDEAVKKQNKVSNPNREKPGKVASAKTRKGGAGKISMGNLTSEERKMYDQGIWANDEDFLEDVKDMRKGE